jgi:hypothetical protein
VWIWLINEGSRVIICLNQLRPISHLRDSSVCLTVCRGMCGLVCEQLLVRMSTSRPPSANTATTDGLASTSTTRSSASSNPSVSSTSSTTTVSSSSAIWTLRSGDGPPRIRSTRIYQTIVVVDMERVATESAFGEVNKVLRRTSSGAVAALLIAVAIMLKDRTLGESCVLRVLDDAMMDFSISSGLRVLRQSERLMLSKITPVRAPNNMHHVYMTSSMWLLAFRQYSNGFFIRVLKAVMVIQLVLATHYQRHHQQQVLEVGVVLVS